MDDFFDQYRSTINKTFNKCIKCINWVKQRFATKEFAIIAIPTSEEELYETLKKAESKLTPTLAQKLLEKRILVAACFKTEWDEQEKLLQSASDIEELSVYLVKFQYDDADRHFGPKSNIMVMSDALKSAELGEIRVTVHGPCTLSKLLSGIYYKI